MALSNSFFHLKSASCIVPSTHLFLLVSERKDLKSARVTRMFLELVAGRYLSVTASNSREWR